MQPQSNVFLAAKSHNNSNLTVASLIPGSSHCPIWTTSCPSCWHPLRSYTVTESVLEFIVLLFVCLFFFVFFLTHVFFLHNNLTVEQETQASRDDRCLHCWLKEVFQQENTETRLQVSNQVTSRANWEQICTQL